jgi:3-methyladenine DNA glycosylase AlkD
MKPQRIRKNDVLGWLEQRGTRRNVEGMARYGIVAKRVFGVPIKTLRVMQRRLGTDHAMAAALWASGR